MRWIAALTLGLLFGVADPAPPLAIKGATIVVAPQNVIEKGTIVVRNGLVHAVGADVEVPKDAAVIDGAGLTVYAGFIDGRTTAGLPDTKRAADPLRQAEGEKPDFTREAPARMEQANRKGLRPELDAADLVHVSEEALKKHHAGGFTLAAVAAGEEYLAGRSALVTLSGRPRRNALLKGEIGLQASFKTYGDGYPGTSMGVMAHLRQVLLDARHYEKIWAAWKPGRPRPAMDPSLEALQPALRGEMRVFFEAETDREILRAISLAEEFGLRIAVVGGREAWRVASILRAKDIPVVLGLKIPKEPEKKKDAEPEPEKLVRERERLRKEEVRGAVALHEAMVPFSFTTAGLAAPADALANLAVIIESGLPADAALAALTTSPAKLFGLAPTHGTIEPGKAANLTVLSAPLGDKKARVRYVIADGHRFEYEVKADDKKDEKKKRDEEARPAPPVAEIAVEVEADRVPKTRTGGNVLIRNATLLTMSETGTVPGGSILVRGGKIVAAGKDVQASDGVTVIDGTGLFVMPGIIDCHSHIACEGGLNEGTQSVTPEVRVTDVLEPGDIAVYRATAGGVTSANVLHGSANAIGGQNATIKLRYDRLPHEMHFPGAPRGVKFALGENPKQSNFSNNRGKRFPNTRMGVEAVFRRAFTEAREYEEALKRDPLTRRDLRLEALLGIVRGEIAVHCHCYRAEEILMILRVAKDFGFPVRTLQHVLEGYRVAPEIAAAGAGASTFSDWWAYKIEAYEAIPHNAALMTQGGVVTSINSDSPEQIRHLNVEAAKTMKYGGLTEEQALAQVTINPARQLGIDAYAGSIAPGKHADLAIYRGHPLSPYSRCVMTLIDGEVVFESPAPASRATPDFAPSQRLRRGPGPLPKHGPVAIVNARIHPVSAEPFRGTIILRDGKISGLGASLRPPAEGEVIDGEGLSVYPGLIDAFTTLGLTEIGSVAGTRDDAEIGLLQPDLKSFTAVNPHSELIPVTRANGITTVLTRPLSGLVSGQSAVIRLDGWVPAEMAVKEIFALHVDYPAPPEAEDKKAEHEKRLKSLRELFEAAKRHEGDGKDLPLEALRPYVRGERPVVFEADRAREIRAALKFADEMGLKPILSGGREAWKVADLLAQKKVPVIIGGVMEIPFDRHDPYDSVFANAAKLSAAGVKFAISSAESFAGNSRNTPYHAAWASAYGLDREEALKAVTLYPAQILGVDDRLGTLEVGKDADVIVTTGDPLEVVTDVVYVFIAGRAVPLDSKHTRLYDKFRQRLK